MSVDFESLVLTPCMNTFGRPAIYHYKSGQTTEIDGVFDDVTRLVDTMGGPDAGNSGIVGTRVVIGIRLADLPEYPELGDYIMINDDRFYVQEVQKDGQGGAHLILNNADLG